MARSAGATGASNAVHVVLGVHGYVEVDHRIDALDVDAAAHHVRGDKHLDLALAEPLEGLLARLLRAVSVHHVHLEACALEDLRDIIHAVLGAAEDQHALRLHAGAAAGLDKCLQELRLLALRDGAEVLLHGVGGLAHASNLHVGGVSQQRVDGALDAGWNGCREEQRLVLLGQSMHNAADAGPKAHVEHAVGLVEHKHLHLGKAHVVVLHEVEQAPRRGNQQVAALLELRNLLVKLGATHHDDGALARLLAHHAHHVVDLRGKLARWCYHQGERLLASGLLTLNELQRRQGEGSGLAGARLRGGNHVAPLKDNGNRLCLNGSWCVKAKGIHPGKNLLV